MNCEETQTAILDDLAARLEEPYKSHLEHCAHCRKLCDDLSEMDNLLVSLRPEVDLPSDFEASVLRQVAQRKAGSFLTSGWFIAGSAALCLVFGLSFFWSAHRTPLTEPGMEQAGSLPPFEEVLPDHRPLADPAFVDLIIEDSEAGDLIVRVPSVIEVRRTKLHDDFYINYVSH